MIFERFTRWVLLVLIFSIPFGTRKFLALYDFGNYTELKNLTVSINEFHSLFLYATDVLLVAFLVLFLIISRKGTKEPDRRIVLSLTVFLAIAAFSVLFAPYKLLAFFRLFQLVALAAAAIAVSSLVRENTVKISHIFTAFAASAFLQSIIAISQFIKQKSIGLWFLGESRLGIEMAGVAKTKALGLEFLRSYGTMPHANILAAFLILGLLSAYYLFLKTRKKPFGHLPLTVAITFLWAGLLFTFSRGGWIIAVIATATLVVSMFLNETYREKAIQLLYVCAATCLFLIAGFGWLVFPRIGFVAAEPSVSYRLAYNQMAIELIKEKPLGVGIGNQVPYAIDGGLYRERGLTHAWEWQPVHNLYLLAASELGIIGLVAFVVFLALLFLKRRRDTGEKNFQLEVTIPAVMFVSLLLFGFIDHFLWDLQAGKLMFWAILGLMMSAGPHSSKDPAPEPQH